jgi:hypothetical protein
MGATAGRVPAVRGDDDADDGEPVDQVLELRAVPVAAYGDRLMAAVRPLDRRPGTPGVASSPWRLLVQIGDAPEVAMELPSLLAHLTRLAIRHERTRTADGGQHLRLARPAGAGLSRRRAPAGRGPRLVFGL